MIVILKFCCFFFSEVTLELYLGDTERDGDLEALLLLFFEVTLELYLGDTECDGDLECLVLFLFELNLELNLGKMNAIVTLNFCHSLF